VPRRAPTPRWPLLLLALALGLPGCRDEGAERYARARAAADSLLGRGVEPRSAAFDAILADLEGVPAGSAHAAEAHRLAEAIRRGRALVRTPLAMVPTAGTRPGPLEVQLAACARLAGELGRDGGVRGAGLLALEACRRRAEAMDVHFAHADEPDAGAE
jgi:hypothetical protein